jgi:hypothetical protein
MHRTLNTQTRNQSNQSHNQPRRPGRPRRSRSNMLGQANKSFKDLPTYRDRLRSSLHSSQDCPQSCRCQKCQSMRSERRLRINNNFPTLLQLLSRQLIPRKNKPCFPEADTHNQFCTRYPHCIHGVMHRSRSNKPSPRKLCTLTKLETNH